MILIHHHLGLGDHIICNGMVRELLLKHPTEQVVLACKFHNLQSVSSMYSDTNLKLLVGDDSFIESKYKEYNYVYRIGFSDLILNTEFTVEQQFYKLAEIDFTCKYTSSRFPYVDRQENSYIFVHDDPSRGMIIPIIDSDCVYRPKNQFNNILDYIPIIKRAKEIHVIESSFMHLIECLPDVNCDLFVHKVRKHKHIAENPKLIKKWISV